MIFATFCFTLSSQEYCRMDLVQNNVWTWFVRSQSSCYIKPQDLAVVWCVILHTARFLLHRLDNYGIDSSKTATPTAIREGRGKGYFSVFRALCHAYALWAVCHAWRAFKPFRSWSGASKHCFWAGVLCLVRKKTSPPWAPPQRLYQVTTHNTCQPYQVRRQNVKLWQSPSLR